jgi:BirA family biotin operon repressor/biotin-[acetyl-CoA-carboxylase] ligase
VSADSVVHPGRPALFRDEDEGREYLRAAGTARMGSRLRYFNEVDSTNARARRLVALDWPLGTVVVAEHQTRGRGRLGRSWACPERAGLLTSVVVPARPLEHGRPEVLSPWLTAAGVLAMVSAIDEVCGGGLSIEWPNDIVARDGDDSRRLRKVGGVLVETSANPDMAVLGVGLNVDVDEGEFPPELRETAASLLTVFGAPVDRKTILKAFLLSLEARIGDPSSLADELRERSATIGREYQINSLQGTAVGIDDQMRLVVEFPDGRLDAVTFRTAGETA